MSGFIASLRTSATRGVSNENGHEPLVAAFQKKGMTLTRTLERHGCAIYLFRNSAHDPEKALSVDSEGRYCTYVGTLIYKGRTAKEATSAILGDIGRGRNNCIDQAIGNYCLILCDLDRIRIVTDRAGLHHVYHDNRLSLFSNSFLAMANAFPRPTLAMQEILEFVQLGATFGPATLASEVMLLEPESEVQITNSTGRLVGKKSVWVEDEHCCRSMSPSELMANTLGTCDDYYSQLESCFGDRITAALSGGYDSRLNLALLRRHRVKPKLFVYGAASDIDVRVAKTICQSEGIELQHIDRDDHPQMDPDAYWQNQERVFQGLDGLTQYGFACAPYELSHRQERVTGGLIAVNGGGGEIWRDFWKLPDKPISAEAFVESYVGGRLGGILGGKSVLRRFKLNMAEKVRAITGTARGLITSATIQSLYARFRVRFWQGKNNSIDNHVGYAVTPFSEAQFSVPAMWIPMRAKRDGWFERQLIQHVDPALARYTSSYGYDFEKGPAQIVRMRNQLTYKTPMWLRVLRRSASRSNRTAYYHTAQFVHARFGRERLEVERYFSLAALRDPLAFSRALTIERMLRGEWG